MKYVMLLWAILCGTMVSAQKTIKQKATAEAPAAMPKEGLRLREYCLPAEQVPAGFKAKQLTAEAREESGLNTNPGYTTNESYIGSVYEGMDLSLVAGMLVAVYQPLDQRRASRELGYYVLEYKSEADRELEMGKIKSWEGKKVFYTGNIILLAWSDAGGFEEQAATIARYFVRKYKLTPLVLPESELVPEQAAAAE